MFDFDDQAFVLYLAGCTLARKPGKQNWVEEKAVDGLPEYICRIARAIHRDGSKSISQSIAIAVSRAKVWAAGGGGVTAATSAKAAKAVAEWEKKKKAAKADNKVKMSNILNLSSYNVDNIRKQYTEGNVSAQYRWVRELWNDHLIVMIEEKADSPAKFMKVPYTVDKKTGLATFGTEVEVKQAYVELSNLQSPLTDVQLEKATTIPCTQKANRSLLETVRLAHQLKLEESELLKLSSSVRNLL